MWSIEDYDDEDGNYEACDECSGEGKIDCYFCENYSGTCERCGGSEKLLCPACSGSGKE